MKNLKTFLLLMACTLTSCSFAQVRYYASNRAQNAINTYQEDGTYIEEFIAQNAGGLSSPQDIVLHPDGFLLVSGSDNPRILKFDLETGDFLGAWSDASFALGRPSKMSIGPDNLLYVTQWGQTSATARVVRFDLEGNYLGGFTPVAPTGLGHLWDAEGNFYLAVFGVNTGIGDVRKYDTSGAFVEAFVDTSILENPTYIWWDDNGDMYVQDFTQGKVLRYDSEGNYLEDYITDLLSPEGYQFLSNGNLLISERTGNQIKEFDTNGNLIGRWDNGGILNSPNFIKALDLSTLGISEKKIDAVLVTPTIGTVFTIHTEIHNDLENLTIYNNQGKKIETIHHTTLANIIDTTNYAEGIYLITASYSDGRIATQKIVVQK